jgi:hypothetical protein
MDRMETALPQPLRSPTLRIIRSDCEAQILLLRRGRMLRCVRQTQSSCSSRQRSSWARQSRCWRSSTGDNGASTAKNVSNSDSGKNYPFD